MESPLRPHYREAQEPAPHGPDLARDSETSLSSAKVEEQERLKKRQHFVEEFINKYRVVEASFIRSQQTERKTTQTEAHALAEKRANEEVMNNVIGAAEHNAPIETMYELRHEIKDVPTDPHQPMAGSGIAAGSNTQTVQQNSTVTSQVNPKARKRLKAVATLKSPLYQKAILLGVGIGFTLFIVVAITIVVFL